jgi:hypothetical protein
LFYQNKKGTKIPMSSKEQVYPFEQEPKEPEQAFGEVALDGTPVEIDDQSTGEQSVDVTTSNEQDELSALGYTEDRASDFDPYNRT